MVKNKTRIIIADDHPIIRQGVANLISERDDLEIVGEANDGKTALDLIRRMQPDISILDVQMPNVDGFEVVKTIKNEKLQTKVILLTMFNEEAFVKKVFELGVKGYILKESAISDILKCVDAISKGEFFVSPQVSNILLNMDIKQKQKNKIELTVSEERILKLIGTGKGSKEIADELFVSIKTVENHRSNICKKLGITGNAALLKYALRTTSGSK